MYLGHHHGVRRETGEPQLVFNYFRGFTDFIVRFTFGNGVHFRSPKATEAIVPDLLKMVWEVHNDKEKVLLEIGQTGSISGDSFTKVAWEPEYVDPAGNYHEGRVRILPLNPSFAFPEWHPHDRERFLRFKLKYRFWSTTLDGTRQVMTFTEIITDEFIEEYLNDELIDQRPNPLGMVPIVHIPNYSISGSPWGLPDCYDIINLNRHYNEVAEQIADIVAYHCVDDETEVLTAGGWKHQHEVVEGELILALDPDTKEITWQPATFNRFDYDGTLIKWDNRIDALTTPGHRWLVERRRGRDKQFLTQVARTSQATDGDLAVGGLTQASRIIVGGGIPAAFSHEPKWSDELVETVGWYVTEGCDLYSGPRDWHSINISQSEIANPEHVEEIRRLASYWRAEGGTFTEGRARRTDGKVAWYLGKGVVGALEEAAPKKQLTPEFVRSLTYRQAVLLHKILLDGDGTRSGSHVMFYQKCPDRTDGFQMLCSMLGIRTNKMVVKRDGTYAVRQFNKNHILAEETSRRAEEVPYTGTVWCPTVEGGFWMARRNGHTYWTGNSAPITIVAGAKIDNLEKGASKVWGGLPKDAQVFNLEGGYQGLQSGLQYLDMLKRSMHEMTGVPESALGQAQPISNTSGVALSIQFQPLMNRRAQKVITYSKGLEQINEIALRTLAWKRPDLFVWNEATDTPLNAGQLDTLDLADPLTYQSYAHFPPPLPLDKLVVLNELQQKMQLGLESREGALRTLGEEFPEEKLAEIRSELQEDALQDGSLQLMKAQIQKQIMDITGMQVAPDGTAIPMDPIMTGSGDVIGDGVAGPNPSMQPNPMSLELEAEIQNRLVTEAYGTKLAQFRSPDSSDSSEE
jgi:hypothetical protein